MVITARSKAPLMYTTYESPNLANQTYQKLDVFDRELEGKHST